jgi:hypothetical protein
MTYRNERYKNKKYSGLMRVNFFPYTFVKQERACREYRLACGEKVLSFMSMHIRTYMIETELRCKKAFC